LGGQAQSVAALIAAAGTFTAAQIVRDYAGLDRIVLATRLESLDSGAPSSRR
jgi:methylase of polypeptide subunit release factors